MTTLVEYENIFFIKGMLTNSDLLTKNETARELRLQYPNFTGRKSVMVNGPAGATL